MTAAHESWKRSHANDRDMDSNRDSKRSKGKDDRSKSDNLSKDKVT